MIIQTGPGHINSEHTYGGRSHEAFKVLRQGKNERMAGSVPVWENPQTAKQSVEKALEVAAINPVSLGRAAPALSYAPPSEIPVASSEAFGFSDLVDMVNPLQHIPLVSTAYRELTGDQIKPIGRVVGGAIFGGPAGGALGLANAAIVSKTGKDFGEHTLALAMGKSLKSVPITVAEHPQIRLERAAQNGGKNEDLPASLLAFAGQRHESGIIIRRAAEETASARVIIQRLEPTSLS